FHWCTKPNTNSFTSCSGVPPQCCCSRVVFGYDARRASRLGSTNVCEGGVLGAKGVTSPTRANKAAVSHDPFSMWRQGSLGLKDGRRHERLLSGRVDDPFSVYGLVPGLGQ
ncbi:hypothetical protein KC19_2G045200, partial [Ceratodon purpureus]